MSRSDFVLLICLI